MAQITVVNAIYGMSGASMDVTANCQAQVNTNPSNFISVTNAALGGDPDPGNRKSFAIIFYNSAVGGSAMRVATCAEESTLYLDTEV